MKKETFFSPIRKLDWKQKCLCNYIKFPFWLSDCQPHRAVTQRALALPGDSSATNKK